MALYVDRLCRAWEALRGVGDHGATAETDGPTAEENPAGENRGEEDLAALDVTDRAAQEIDAAQCHLRLSATAVQLALDFPLWVRRRVERITFIDDKSIRRETSVTFEMPLAADLAAPPAEAETILVPLHILRNASRVTNLDVRDESGQSLPVLQTRENGVVAASGLATILGHLTPEGEKALLAITTDPDPVTAEERFDSELDNGALAKAYRGDEEYREYRGLTRDLAKGHLLLVPLSYRTGARRVITFVRESPHEWHGDDSTEDDSTVPWLWRLLTAIGWADKSQKLQDRPVGWGRGYHVELLSPEDVEVVEATFALKQYDPDKDGIVETDLPVAGGPRTHLIAPRALTDPVPERFDEPPDRTKLLRSRADTGSVIVTFRPQLTGVFSAGVIVSVLSTALLWLAQARLAELDGQTSAAVLLLLPAALTAYLVRAGEHAFATRLLFGVRMLRSGWQSAPSRSPP